jgi:probable DNA metabolism protein
MCDSKEFEMDLLCYIITGFKSQRELQNINMPCIFSLHAMQKEFFHVYHKMSGFLRFEELEDGTLYAKLEAKYNVLYLLGAHFSKRLNNQNYIIHDIKRELAFLHTKEFVGVQRVADFELPTHSKDEAKFQKLWKTFFTSVAIKSRENKKLQRQTVPLLYRTYMSEFMS